MTFTDALSTIFNDNHHVRRRVWNNRVAYLQKDQHQRCCTTYNSETNSIDGLLHPWIMTESDYFAEDWEVVE